MANALYAKTLEAWLNGGGPNWASDTIKAVLVDAASYTADLANHDFLNDVPGGARVGTPQTLASKTSAAGVADAADINFPTVPAGSALEYILIYADSGVESTSRLIMLLDTATGLPVTPGGGDVPITWPGSGIFKI